MRGRNVDELMEKKNHGKFHPASEPVSIIGKQLLYLSCGCLTTKLSARYLSFKGTCAQYCQHLFYLLRWCVLVIFKGSEYDLRFTNQGLERLVDHIFLRTDVLPL